MEGMLDKMVSGVVAKLLQKKRCYHRDELGKKALRGFKKQLKRLFKERLSGRSLSQSELIEKLQELLLSLFNIDIDCSTLQKQNSPQFALLATKLNRGFNGEQEHAAFHTGYKKDVIALLDTQIGHYLLATPFFHIWIRYIESTEELTETTSLSHYIEDIHHKLENKPTLFEEELTI